MIRIEQADFREVARLGEGGWADLVVSNPPYGRLGSGRISADPKRALACQERPGTLPGVFAAAAHLLRPGGRLALIYPPTRLGEAILSGRRFGLALTRLTAVHSRSDRPARLFYAVWQRGGRAAARILPSLVTHAADGSLSPEMQQHYLP